MRVALVADIHGNDVAFAALLGDLDRVGVDAVVCLGDVLQGGAQPAQAASRLRGLGWPTVLGNADAFLVEVDPESPEPLTQKQLEVRDWSAAQLGDEGVELIRSFERTLEVPLGEQRALCFHASPRSYDDVLIPEDEHAALEPFLGHGGFHLLAGGHTHKQWTRIIDGTLFVNPGSVGLAWDHHQPQDDFKLTPVAEYAVAFSGPQGLGVEFRRVPYSYEELLTAIRASGRPHAEDFAEQWRQP